MKTLVIGASLKEVRYSNKAIKKLRNYNHEVKAIGLREGEIMDVKIIREKKSFKNIHTVTLYLNSKRQKEYYEYVLSLKPQRVIFNPGTENIEFQQLLKEANIYFEDSCTLVLLSTRQYQ